MIQHFDLFEHDFINLNNEYIENLTSKTDFFKHNFDKFYIIQCTKKVSLLNDLEKEISSKSYKNNLSLGEFYLSREESSFKSTIPLSMSFDTVKFGVPCSPVDFQYYSQSFKKLQKFEKYQISTFYDEIESSNEKFVLVTPDEANKINSYNNKVVFYYSESGYVIFEMSIPKQLYGHNSLMFWQLDTFFDRFRNYLIHILESGIEHWENWILKRVDVCYNHYLKSYEEVKNTLDYLSNLRIRNKPCNRTNGKNYPYWSSSSRTIKFYSKYDEMLLKDHKSTFDSSIYEEVLQGSKNILRFEEEWRQRYLLLKLRVTKVNDLTVKRFINYAQKEYNKNRHIIDLLGEASMVDKKFSLKDTLLCIQKFKKPKVYLDFVTSIIDDGLDKTKKSMPKSSYYDIVKSLKEIGIDVSVINERFHQSLESNTNKPNMRFFEEPLSNINDEEAMFIQSNIKREPNYILSDDIKGLRDFLMAEKIRFNDIYGSTNSLPIDYEVQILNFKDNKLIQK